jgi:hypothetical protein
MPVMALSGVRISCDMFAEEPRRSWRATLAALAPPSLARRPGNRPFGQCAVAPVQAAPSNLDAVPALARGARLAEGSVEQVLVIRVNQGTRVGRHEFGQIHTDQLQSARVGIGMLAVQTDGPYPVHRVLGELTVARFARPRHFLGPLAVGNVAHHRIEGFMLLHGDQRQRYLSQQRMPIVSGVGPLEAVHALGFGEAHHGLGLIEGRLSVRLRAQGNVAEMQMQQGILTSMAEQLHGGLVGCRDAVILYDQGGVRGQLEQAAEALVAGA